MADVRIRFSPDRAAAAERLRKAVSAAGYAVDLDHISDPEDLTASEDQHRTGSATILIWSRPLLSSALRPDLLRKLRQQRNLIEVSADGVGPMAADGDTHVILISGWRGQPFHPGWQRIASDLKRICGPRKDAPETDTAAAQPRPPSVPPSVAQRASSEGKGSNWWSSSGRLVLALLAAAGLFSAGFAVSSWTRNEATVPQQQPPGKTEAKQAERVPIAGQPAMAPDAGTGGGPSVPPRANSVLASSEPATVEPRPIQASSATAPASPAARNNSKATPREATKGSASRSARSRAPASSEKKRYSRNNSRTMRLFCEGSGRSTPQCRTFLRSTDRSLPRIGPE